MMGKNSVGVFGRQRWESRKGDDLVHRLVHLLRRMMAEAERVGREQERQQDKKQQAFMQGQTNKQAFILQI